MSQNRPNLIKNEAHIDESEISLIDILRFLKCAYKVILVFAALGISAAVAYLAITPKQYQADAQITMAQIGSGNNSPQGAANIEEPALLIKRFSMPTSFTQVELDACGYPNQTDGALILSKSIKLQAPKGTPNIVEIKTFGPTAEVARKCGMAIFELIKTTQSQMIAPYIERAKVKLAGSEERLDNAQGLLAKANKSSSVMTAAYLSTHDQIRYLLDEITGLKNVIASSQNLATRLVTPMYVNYAPIFPKDRIVLAGGLFGGLFLGLFVAIGRRIIEKLKNDVDDIL